MEPLTKLELVRTLKEYGVITNKDLNKALNKTKKELLFAIAKVAIDSPTTNQFNKLEERVSSL